ncbi:MAG: Transcriptional regulatory protein ZraR [Syntrophorhabdus sp. PtaU1.Bin050]|nr:MAG: Transcriptional regulatory protein ZraR [Syntrophorhabdus sp. PtaU1.Bin050]
MSIIRVLIVDDEVQLAEAFRKQLTKEGMEVFTASRAKEALALLKNQTIDVCVLDIKLPDLDGVELLVKLKHIEPTLEVIMLTGYASVDTAIRSMKLGAYDYLTKPCKMSELSAVIAKAYEKKSLREQNILLEEHLQRIGVHDKFIGEGKETKKVKGLISLVAPSTTPILITGETGTGKELVARAIHDASLRSKDPFVAINSSALQETMLESELFGYKKGAFTGAQDNKPGLLEIANKGTFFVDEVGDMGLNIQAKLLRVLESGTFMKLGDTKETRVDTRFVFATNKDLKDEIEKGRFRKDLFFRINAFTITLPPLREKREDIPLLADYFVNKFTRGTINKRFSRAAMDLLMGYDWPGNVRELANVVERSVLLSGRREEIVVDDFPEGMVGGEPPVIDTAGIKPMRNGASLADLETEHIKKVLQSVGGNKAKAARLLGISRKKLYSRITEKTGNPGKS